MNKTLQSRVITVLVATLLATMTMATTAVLPQVARRLRQPVAALLTLVGPEWQPGPPSPSASTLVLRAPALA